MRTGPRRSAPAARRLLLLGAAAGLALLSGCGDAAAPERTTDEAAKQRTLKFWQALNEANALRTKGRIEEAARGYESALALDPRHEDSLYYLGQCRQALGMTAGARQAFERLIEVNPASARGHLALAALLSSPEPGAALDLGAAEAHLRRAHEINGEETGPMVRLGEIRLVRGDEAEAARWLEAALRTNPKSGPAAFLLGYLRWEAGDAAGARDFYARALAALRAEAPVKGVLSEGDRKPAATGPGGRLAAPPLEEPLGRTLLADLYAPLRGAAPGPPEATAPIDIDRTFSAVRPRLVELQRRSS